MLHERDDALAFCTILQVLALALTDQAFLSDWVEGPGDIATIKVPSHLNSVPLHWKPEIKNKPIFRAAEQGEHGWKVSDTVALGYSHLAEKTGLLVEDSGFEQHLTFYALRRGAGNVVNGLCPGTY